MGSHNLVRLLENDDLDNNGVIRITDFKCNEKTRADGAKMKVPTPTPEFSS